MKQMIGLGLLLFATTGVLPGAVTGFTPFAPEWDTFIHDPSTIVQDGARYYVFGTGPGIRSKSSSDLRHWTNGPAVFRPLPAWTFRTVPGFRGYCWAPDVLRVGGKFLLYYAVSTWGKQVSAIGLATNPTLDPSAENYHWTDCGPVLVSTNGSPFNAIDPSVFQDDDGTLWLAFGSYWRGIYLTELNPQTGQRLTADSPLYPLAWNDSIEAACLTRHGKYYYLFVNWGQCCRGTNSTYEIRVGRAETITGPYRDRDEKNMLDGGGTPFLQSHGRFIGPGHLGIVHGHTPDGATWFSFHYYDADTAGRSRLALGRIDWSSGWPVPVNVGISSAGAATNDRRLLRPDGFDVHGLSNPVNRTFEGGLVLDQPRPRH
jgi:arabinan endo-1,5-alpha-L-arabinosidase